MFNILINYSNALISKCLHICSFSLTFSEFWSAKIIFSINESGYVEISFYKYNVFVLRLIHNRKMLF